MFQLVCCSPPASYQPIPVGTDVVSIHGPQTGQSGRVVRECGFMKGATIGPFSLGIIGYRVMFKLAGEQAAYWGSIVPVNKRDDEHEDFDITSLDDVEAIEITT